MPRSKDVEATMMLVGQYLSSLDHVSAKFNKKVFSEAVISHMLAVLRIMLYTIPESERQEFKVGTKIFLDQLPDKNDEIALWFSHELRSLVDRIVERTR